MGRQRKSNFSLLKTHDDMIYVVQHRSTGLLLGYLRRPKPGVTSWRGFYSNEYAQRCHKPGFCCQAGHAEIACAHMWMDIAHRRMLDTHGCGWLPDHSSYVVRSVLDCTHDFDAALMNCPFAYLELLDAISTHAARNAALLAGSVHVLREIFGATVSRGPRADGTITILGARYPKSGLTLSPLQRE